MICVLLRLTTGLKGRIAMPLERVLETEYMDTSEEAHDYDEMDHSDVNRVFVDDFLAAGGGGDILDLGTGTAQIPIELCSRGVECRIMASDMAVAMLEHARLNIEIAGYIEQIQLAQLDAKELPCEAEYFDSVMSNSIVHHIPEPRPVFAEAVRVVRAGGLLFFRDLLRPDDEDTLQQLVATYAGEANEHQQKMFSDSLRAALTVAEVQALVGELGFPADSVQATSDRHWTWNARKPGGDA
jgi:ubiquinone/menaquinone biosynthesis C-methylase UbiE